MAEKLKFEYLEHYIAPDSWLEQFIAKKYLPFEANSNEEDEIIGLREFTMFVVKIYLEHWFKRTSATNAALNDVKLLKELKQYRQINQPLADTALSVVSRHLIDISLGLLFFDPRYSQESLLKMARALKKAGDERNLFHNVSIDIEDELDVPRIISKNSTKFFEIVGVNCDFIEKSPSQWYTNENYKKIEKIARSLTVVNDPAERAIGLLKTVNNTLTKDLSEQNDLIQVIEEFNNKHPNGNKSTILSNLCGNKI